MTTIGNIPGVYEGAPSGSTVPDPRLTHWVSWDGGFCAWARPLPGDHMLLVVCEDGEDWAQAQPGEAWTVVVLDTTNAEAQLESECKNDGLADQITWSLAAELARQTRALACTRKRGCFAEAEKWLEASK